MDDGTECARCGDRPHTISPYCEECWMELGGCPHKWNVAGLWICMYDDNDFQCEPRKKRGDCPLDSENREENES